MRKPLTLLVCFALPALVLTGGLILAGLFGFRQIPELFEETARGMIPQGFEAKLEKRGKYTVWLPVEGDGLSESSQGRLPPGGRVYVFDAASARELELMTWIKGEKFIGDERSVSLGSFESRQDGQIVEVKGTGLSEPVMVSISIDNTGQKLATVFTLIAIVGITLMAAITLFIFLLHRRQKSVDASFETS